MATQITLYLQSRKRNLDTRNGTVIIALKMRLQTQYLTVSENKCSENILTKSKHSEFKQNQLV